MRIIGFLLLGFIFLTAMLSATTQRKVSVMTFGKYMRELPNQETFTRKEVEQILWKTAFDGEIPFTQAMLPPLLALTGGILLDQSARRRRKNSEIVS